MQTFCVSYEVGFAAETGWQGEDIPPFDYVAELLDSRIGNICAIVEATAPPLLYLTGKTNFRNAIAKRKPYKDRASVKPWHFNNLTAYIKGKYDWRLVEGLEADDLMAIEQFKQEALFHDYRYEAQDRTIICTRDKDLRQVSGWHFGWELGNQPQFGPYLVQDFGTIKLSDKRDKITGWGEKFFWSQCLTGDVVDSIPGLDKCGPVKAFDLLGDSNTPEEAFKAVLGAYRASYGDKAEEELLEQGRLLWMTRELNEDGSPVLWKLPI